MAVTTKNIFENFVDSVLIVDEKENEIEGLKNALEKKDIWVTYLNPPQDKNKIEEEISPLRNRKLIFFDLYLDETKNIKDNLSTIIRPFLKNAIGKNFGDYGIVMWTKHDEHIDIFKEKIQSDKEKYDLPLFIVNLDKTQYLSKEKQYENIFEDLKEQLKNNIAANFFINWSNIIENGKYKTIKSIYELVPDYKKKDKNLEFILFKMAQSYTGIPLEDMRSDYNTEKDLINVFGDILRSEIIGINNTRNSFDFFSVKERISFKKQDNNEVSLKTKPGKVGDELLDIYSLLNNKLLIDENYLQQGVIFPGNVYEIKDPSSIHFDMPTDAKPIFMEMTPPCDFSNKKSLMPRVLFGYIAKYDFKFQSKACHYKELMPIKLGKDNETKMIIFDFRMVGMIEENDLRHENKYKLLFRANDKLFADILQKMSSHIARLGLSIIK